MIHAASLAIGAGIASVAIIVAFLAFDISNDKPELAIVPTPIIQEIGPAKITSATFMENGSPIMGEPNAPITLVEFGDYQCYFCNQFFHTFTFKFSPELDARLAPAWKLRTFFIPSEKYHSVSSTFVNCDLIFQC